jgi:hypothetical protein
MVTSNTVMWRLIISFRKLHTSVSQCLPSSFGASLRSILLNLQDRYIGISFTALTIAIIYLYISDVYLVFKINSYSVWNVVYSLRPIVSNKLTFSSTLTRLQQPLSKSSNGEWNIWRSSLWKARAQPHLYPHKRQSSGRSSIIFSGKNSFNTKLKIWDSILTKLIMFQTRGCERKIGFQFYDDRVQGLE